MSPIRDFKCVYVAPNKENIFSDGDTVEGKITFVLKEETKVKGVIVKVKGDARVHWSEGTGDRRRSHSDHRRYFKDKVCLVEEDMLEEGDRQVRESADDSRGGRGVVVERIIGISNKIITYISDVVLPEGDHRFDFKLKIPQGDFPSSFKGLHGSVVYMLEAKISRSWRAPSCEKRELAFLSKSFPHLGSAMYPTSGSVVKDVGVFSKGQVKLSASVDRKLCCPGDTLFITGTVSYSSSKDTKLKFSLHQKIVYRAYASTNVCDLSLCKMVGDTIKGNSEETFSCQMKIPDDAINTVQNCEIIFVDYYVKVYVDISFAADPEVKLPVVITSRLPSHAFGQTAPLPAGAGGAPSYSDFPLPTFAPGPYPVPAPPGPYGFPVPNPSQYGNPGGNWPQQAAPFGFYAPSFPPSLNQQQMPAVVEHQPPPDYTSLYPPLHGNNSNTGLDEKK